MSAFFFSKQPSEEFSIAVDFASLRLESGESVDSYTVTAVLCRDNSDATSVVIDSDAEDAGVVTIGVKNGGTLLDDGSWQEERYRITVKVITDVGSKYEADIVMAVIDR